MEQDTSKRHKIGSQPLPHQLRHLISVSKEKGQMEEPGRVAGLGPSEPSSRREASLQVGSGEGGCTYSLPHWMMEGSGINGNARNLLQLIWGSSAFSWFPNCLHRKGKEP